MIKTGFVKKELIVTLKDHPGVMSVILHTDVTKCQLNCYKCHNKHSVDESDHIYFFYRDQLKEKLKLVKNINTELIIVSGGEPTLSETLFEDLNIFVEEGLPVRIDTNGLKYNTIYKLIKEKLISGIALDIKIPIKPKYTSDEIKKYNKILFSRDFENESIIYEYADAIRNMVSLMIKNRDLIPYSLFRTVTYPMLDDNDKELISEFVSNNGFNHYFNTFFEI